MRRKTFNNYVSISKAIVIILMVIGHSGCPYWLDKVIYSYHMPFFFICSGFFFTPASSVHSFLSFFLRKVKGIYLPFIKWSICFLFLHNIFYNLNILNGIYGYNGHVSSVYSFHEILVHGFFIITSMTYLEQLVGGFWFLKDLFLASLFISFITFIARKENVFMKIVIFLSLLISSIITSYYKISIPFLGDVKELLWASTFFYSGYLLSQLKLDKCIIVGSFILFVVINCFPFHLDFFVEKKLMFLVFITSISGAILTFVISRYIEDILLVREFLYYVGNNTLVILGLHFLSFNIVDLIIIKFEGLSLNHLAEFPVIANHQSFWLLYTIVGVLLPVVLNKLYYDLKLKVFEY